MKSLSFPRPITCFSTSDCIPGGGGDVFEKGGDVFGVIHRDIDKVDASSVGGVPEQVGKAAGRVDPVSVCAIRVGQGLVVDHRTTVQA